MTLRGFIDLHCHPVPGVDDGAKSPEDGAALLAGLYRVGFDRVVATPHIRSGYWENRRASLEEPWAALQSLMAIQREAGVVFPAIDLSAEHLFDDVVWELFARGEAMPYPGGKTALVEFSYDFIPQRVELRLWRLKKNGVTPVLAHPERYSPLYDSSERLEELIGAGVLPLLDVMSLVGAYGAKSRVAAERILGEGLYVAACSDSHKPSDADRTAEAISVLGKRVGVDGVRRLMIEGPRKILGLGEE